MVPSDGMVMGVKAPGNPATPLDCETVFIDQMDDSTSMLYQILLQEDERSIRQIPLGQMISINRFDKVITLETQSVEYERLIISPRPSSQPSDGRLWLHLLEKALKLQKSMPSKFVRNASETTLNNRRCVQHHSDSFFKLIKTEEITSDRRAVPHVIEIQISL